MMFFPLYIVGLEDAVHRYREHLGIALVNTMGFDAVYDMHSLLRYGCGTGGYSITTTTTTTS